MKLILAGEVILTNTDNIELEATFQQLSFDLRGDAIETNMASRMDCGLLWAAWRSSSRHVEEDNSFS